MRSSFRVHQRHFRAWIGTLGVTLSTAAAITAGADQPTSDFYTDPATGIVFRRVVRTVHTPVTETKMTQQEQTVYVPETVVESRPEVRRTITPVTEYRWQPRMENRWNPFVEPRVAYYHVPETRWQSRDEVVTQTQTRVQWKPEKKVSQIPQQVTRYETQQKVDYEPVGRVATPPRTDLDPQIAARLRPIDASTPIAPLSPTAVNPSSSVVTIPPPPMRNTLQTGMRPTDLVPNTGGAYGQPLPTSDVAGLPGLSIWR